MLQKHVKAHRMKCLSSKSCLKVAIFQFAYFMFYYHYQNKWVLFRAVIDIQFFSIRSLTFYFPIPIISMRFWRTALIEYFHMFHTVFVARILRFSQCKDNEGFLNTFWLNTWFSLQNSHKCWLKMAKNVVRGWENVFRLIDITFFSINWKIISIDRYLSYQWRS